MTRNVLLLVGLVVCLSNLLGAAPRQKQGPSLYRVLGKDARRFALEFSPDGKRLLASEVVEDQVNLDVVEWDVAGKTLVRRFDSGFNSSIDFLRFSPSGKLLVVGCMRGKVAVWDEKRRKRYSFESSKNFGTSLLLATITGDKPAYVTSIIAWNIAQRRNIETGETDIYSIPSNVHNLGGAAATRNGKVFAVASPLFLKLYPDGDFDSPTTLDSFKAFKTPTITSLAISEDGSTVMAFDGKTRNLALFDVKKDKLIKKWRDPNHDVNAIVPFNRRTRFATAGEDGLIKIWDVQGHLLASLNDKEHDEPITALAIPRDDRFLASAGEGRPIQVWDLGPKLAPALPSRK